MAGLKGRLGRPRVKATRRQVELLREERWTWEQVAVKLGISRRTAITLGMSGEKPAREKQ